MVACGPVVSFMCGLIGLFSNEVALGAILTMLVTLALGCPTSSQLVALEIGYPTFACAMHVHQMCTTRILRIRYNYLPISKRQGG